MVTNKYNSITHQLTERLAELILESLTNLRGDIYAVYKSPNEVLIALYNSRDDRKLVRYEYVRVLETSDVTRLIRNTPMLQTKTQLEAYLYKVLKNAEHRIEEERRVK